MSRRRIPKDIVLPGFANLPYDTDVTAKNVISMLLGIWLDYISTDGDQMTIMISFALFLLRKSLSTYCRKPKRFILMILKRIFRMLPSNPMIERQDDSVMARLRHLRFQHRELYTGVAELTFAVNMMSGYLRGDIRLSFSEIVHSLSVIQRHMIIAYERNSIILTDIDHEEEKRSWRLWYIGGCPDEIMEVSCVNNSEELLAEFQQRFSDFIERCCFYLWMQIRRSFSQLQ